MTVPSVTKCIDGKPAPAAGQFGMWPGGELPAYRPPGCPSLEQFEAHYGQSEKNLAEKRHVPADGLGLSLGRVPNPA